MISSGLKPNTVMTSGEQKMKTPSGSVSQVQPKDWEAKSPDEGTAATRASASLATPLLVNSFSSWLSSFLLGMTHQLFSQRAILLGRATVRSIARDWLTKDRALTQLGVNFDGGVQDRFTKGGFDLFVNAAMHPVTPVKHGDE